MIAFRRSKAEEPNPSLLEAPRKAGETNRQWLRRALADGTAGAERSLSGHLVLLGGTRLVDFRLRVAQGHTRQDMTPSLWSHAAIITGQKRGGRGKEDDWSLCEVSLEPPHGFGAVPKNNGAQDGHLSHYDDAARFPNIAVFGMLDLQKGRLDEAVREVRRERRMVDIGGLIVEWLAYVWGVGTQANPLLREAGIPCAALVEGIYSLLGVDLTPGSSTRASTPEAIWQTARWWHDYFAAGLSQATAPRGHFFLGQPEAACLFD